MTEKVTKVYNGFLMLATGIILLAATALLFIFSQDGSVAWMMALAVVLLLIAVIVV
jgi:hypothetical protein